MKKLLGYFSIILVFLFNCYCGFAGLEKNNLIMSWWGLIAGWPLFFLWIFWLEKVTKENYE